MKAHLKRTAALIPLALVMTGCMHFSASYTLSADDSVQLTTEVGILASAASLLNGEDMCQAMSEDNSGFPSGSMEPATITGTDKQTYLICRITASTNLTGANEQGVTITHQDGVFSFTMDSTLFDSDDLNDLGVAWSAVMTSFSVSVTFPGKVLTHSGSSTVKGTTVTWTNSADLFTGLSATGKDSGGAGWPLSTAATIGIAAGVIVVVAGVAILVTSSRKRKQAQAAQLAAAQAAWMQQQAAAGGMPYPYAQPMSPDGMPYTQPAPDGMPYTQPTPDYGQPMPAYAPQQPTVPQPPYPTPAPAYTPEQPTIPQPPYNPAAPAYDPQQPFAPQPPAYAPQQPTTDFPTTSPYGPQ